MPLARIRKRGKTRLYKDLEHHAIAKSARNLAAKAEEFPAEWLEFEAFALACKTRQKGGIKGLELYDWQRSLMKLLETQQSVVICKSRQVGGSQALLLRALWRALLEPGFMGLVASKSFADAQLLARRMRRALQGLSGVEPVNDSLSHLVLPNDSQILFRSSSPADGLSRGVDALSFCLCDEYSFWEDGATALGSLGPAMAQTENPELIIVSTPNGKTDDYWHKLTQGMGAIEFERLLEQVREGELGPYQERVSADGMAIAVCHWRAIPAYATEPDFLGRMQKQFGLGTADIKREFELNFEESAQSVFDFALVKAASQHYAAPEFEPFGIYFGGLDPAAQGADYTVFVVLEKRGKVFTVAHLYRRKSGTSEQHMGSISDLIQHYRAVETIIEKNSIGQLYLERISSVCLAQRIEGFTTTAQSKAGLIGRVTLALERGELKIPSGPIEQELLSFRRNGEKLEAAPNAHDDCVIALGLALTAAGYGQEPIAHVQRSGEF